VNSANVALLQLCSGNNIRANLAQIEQQIKQLPSSVKLVMTPENALLFAGTADYQQHAEREGEGPLQRAVVDLAKRYNVWLLIGSMPMYSRHSPNRITTSSLLFDNTGKLQARYDKLHLFDVDIADNHGRYHESDIYQHGQEVTVVDTPVGRLGMTICYDLRFPSLYQSLRDQGADIISVPAAFTRVTGEAHWEILLRARAIENQCWLLAPAQVGRHSEDRSTWGHSMAVDPWGTVVVENADSVGLIKAKVDVSGLAEIRTRMPVAKHNRFKSVLINTLDKSE
jgi:predicted amidohydrolase